MKKALEPDKSVSIAAPASYWYLKAFTIDHIAAAIDYIVYKTLAFMVSGLWQPKRLRHVPIRKMHSHSR